MKGATDVVAIGAISAEEKVKSFTSSAARIRKQQACIPAESLAGCVFGASYAIFVIRCIRAVDSHHERRGCSTSGGVGRAIQLES